MFGLVSIFSLVMALAMAIPGPAREPWSTSDDYFRVVERGFRLDRMPHHVHFVEKGEMIESIAYNCWC